MYYAFVVERATHVCFLQCQEINLDPSIWEVPLVLFLSILKHAKSGSEKPVKFRDTLHRYHRPTSLVPCKYFRILLATLKCESFGSDWNLAHIYITNMISDLLAVKYNKEPIKPLYLV